MPLCCCLILIFWRQPHRRQWTALLLATLWNLPAILLLNCLADHFHWWRFDARGGLLLGMPVEMLFGWMILWGAIPALALIELRLAIVMLIMGGLDLILMPHCAPVLQLNSNWLVGEALALFLCLLPAQLCAIWTIENRRLAARVIGQVIIFSSLLIWILPATIFTLTGFNWQPFLQRSFSINSLLLQLLALPAIVGLTAVQEFAQRGYGTPLPYDPPRRLVTSGVYAYIANPMQFSMSIVLIGWGLILKNLLLASSGLMAIIYSIGLAEWHEGNDLLRTYGNDWLRYRNSVRCWWPRWRPWHRSLSDENEVSDAQWQPARIYYDEVCDPCGRLAIWLRARHPVGLLFIAAQDHPNRDLTRLTYDPADGSAEEEGIIALARALEHINLCWALIGWTMRLPIVSALLQLLSDGVGGEPRQVCRRSLQQPIELARRSNSDVD